MRSTVAAVAVGASVACALVLSLDLWLPALLLVPGLLARLGPTARLAAWEYYLGHLVTIIQYEPGMARYDPGVFYTLKPGRFTFSNLEFSDEFRVNSLGVRDEESALQAPEIVVLGDSYAMGWGVRQEETFPKRLEALTGYKTLDAGISSYSTVRELRLLDRIDTSRLKFLVIQYCDNDLSENELFFRRGNRLKTRGRAVYDGLVARSALNRRYDFGRAAAAFVTKTLGLWPPVGDALWPREPLRATPLQLFCNAFRATRKDLRGVRVIVLEADNGGVDRWVVSALLARKRRLPPGAPERLEALPLAGKVGDADRYVVDSHWRASAHETAARELARMIGLKAGAAAARLAARAPSPAR